MPHAAKKADTSKLLALALREFLFSASWGLLAGALFIPISPYWFFLIPPGVLAAVYYVAVRETAGEGPLQALELKQYTKDGRRNPGTRATYFRILYTVILFPPLLLGWVTLLFGGRSLPELLTGLRIAAADRMLDPRPEKVIESIRRAAETRLWLLIAVPMLASGAMLFLKHKLPEAVSLTDARVKASLPEEERLLLTHYLEMSAQYPGEVEYHIRLASLYHRNDMKRDLQTQLEVIRELAPDHAILLLGDAPPVTFDLLLPSEEDSLQEETYTTLYIPEPTALDTVTTDTVEVVLPDLSATPEETIGPDTVPDVQQDTLEVQEVLPEVIQEDLPAQQDTSTVEELQFIPEQEDEEIPIEPDQILQP